MIDDRELWTCAAKVLEHHGPDVDAFIAARMTDLALLGDEAGVRTWSAIAKRVDDLRDTQGQGRARQ